MGRAIVFGLFLGLTASAGLLCWQAWNNARFECAAPDTEECHFEHQTHGELARLQSYAAVGLACVAGGLFLWSRRRP